MPRDLTQQQGNLSWAIQKNYEQLKNIADPMQLEQALLKLAQEFRGGGLSELNFRKFVQAVKKEQGNLERLQFLMTNFMLKGGGLGVTAPRMESIIDGLASMLCESTSHQLKLNEHQLQLMNLVGRYGYKVFLLNN